MYNYTRILFLIFHLFSSFYIVLLGSPIEKNYTCWYFEVKKRKIKKQQNQDFSFGICLYSWEIIFILKINKQYRYRVQMVMYNFLHQAPSTTIVAALYINLIYLRAYSPLINLQDYFLHLRTSLDRTASKPT